MKTLEELSGEAMEAVLLDGGSLTSQPSRSPANIIADVFRLEWERLKRIERATRIYRADENQYAGLCEALDAGDGA
jgi:hypothetical protein